MNQALIIIKAVSLVFNTLIFASFPFIESPLKTFDFIRNCRIIFLCFDFNKLEKSQGVTSDCINYSVCT